MQVKITSGSIYGFTESEGRIQIYANLPLNSPIVTVKSNFLSGDNMEKVNKFHFLQSVPDLFVSIAETSVGHDSSCSSQLWLVGFFADSRARSALDHLYYLCTLIQLLPLTRPSPCLTRLFSVLLLTYAHSIKNMDGWILSNDQVCQLRWSSWFVQPSP